MMTLFFLFSLNYKFERKYSGVLEMMTYFLSSFCTVASSLFANTDVHQRDKKISRACDCHTSIMAPDTVWGATTQKRLKITGLDEERKENIRTKTKFLQLILGPCD